LAFELVITESGGVDAMGAVCEASAERAALLEDGKRAVGADLCQDGQPAPEIFG
jgi:hypothetical protein